MAQSNEQNFLSEIQSFPVVSPVAGDPVNGQKAKRPNVLLVDDRPENLLTLEAVLETLDCQLIKAASGDEALKHLLQQDFAVILLDVQMPKMDGYETAALIKQRELSCHIPIVFITAINKDPSHVYQGYSSGAVDYIVKPFDPDILKSKVAVFLELWRKTEQVKQQAELLRESEHREAKQRLAESAEQLDHFKPPLEAILDGLWKPYWMASSCLKRTPISCLTSMRERYAAWVMRTAALKRSRARRRSIFCRSLTRRA